MHVDVLFLGINARGHLFNVRKFTYKIPNIWNMMVK